MSQIEWSRPDDEDRMERRSELARALARGGMDGVQIISVESAERVITPKRRAIIEALRTTNVGSVRGLADHMGRDKAQVSRDLATLAEHGVITYEDAGRAKRPVLAQESLLVEPI